MVGGTHSSSPSGKVPGRRAEPSPPPARTSTAMLKSTMETLVLRCQHTCTIVLPRCGAWRSREVREALRSSSDSWSAMVASSGDSAGERKCSSPWLTRAGVSPGTLWGTEEGWQAGVEPNKSCQPRKASPTLYDKWTVAPGPLPPLSCSERIASSVGSAAPSRKHSPVHATHCCPGGCWPRALGWGHCSSPPGRWPSGCPQPTSPSRHGSCSGGGRQSLLVPQGEG